MNPIREKNRKSEAVQPLLFRPHMDTVTLIHVLQQVARAMTPFYRAIATNRRYAQRWSEAVMDADLTKMEHMLRQVSPLAARQGIASNGIGYFISFASPPPIDNVANGVTIPPGSVRFFFETRSHRSLAYHVLPFYRTLAQDKVFAIRLARAILQRDRARIRRLLRACIRTPHLRTIAIQDEGIFLTFAFPFSRFQYQNVLFRDVIEPDWDSEQE